MPFLACFYYKTTIRLEKTKQDRTDDFRHKKKASTTLY